MRGVGPTHHGLFIKAKATDLEDSCKKALWGGRLCGCFHLHTRNQSADMYLALSLSISRLHTSTLHTSTVTVAAVLGAVPYETAAAPV